jgi:hypothetical protein
VQKTGLEQIHVPDIGAVFDDLHHFLPILILNLILILIF